MRKILYCLIAALSLSGTAIADEPIRIAILEFESKGGITPAQMDALADMLANEIRTRGDFKVIGKSDIKSTINLAEKKMQLGCNDDSCFAELGGALGVKWLVVGNISMFGSTYLMNLKLLDVEAVEVAWSASKRISGGEEKLLDALSSAAAAMVRKVFLRGKKADEEGGNTSGNATAAATATAGPEIVDAGMEQQASEKPSPKGAASTTARQNPVPVVIVGKQKSVEPAVAKWGRVITYVGGAGILFGAAATVLSWYEARTYNDTTADAGSRMSAKEKSEMWGGLMWVGYGLGGGLVLTGLLMQWLAPEENIITVGTVPLPDGGALAVGWKW